jgi:hypothetical protein
MFPAATFVNYVSPIKITQYFRRLNIPLVIFPRAARKPAHNNGCGPLRYKGWTPGVQRIAELVLLTGSSWGNKDPKHGFPLQISHT